MTAHVSPFARDDGGPQAVLVPAGRADAAAPIDAIAWVPIGAGLELGRGKAVPEPSRLELDDPLVSSRHARVEPAGDGLRVTDLGSKNGTSLDGRRLDGPALVADGARLFLGNHAFVFRRLSLADREALDEERASPFGPLRSRSAAVARLGHKLRLLAPGGGDLLIVGETGVGKEVFARAVHAASGRRGPFIAVSCAALPSALVESELFGYQAGAHSTAFAGKPGLIEQADGGTLFLDEIAEMPHDGQSKLLRFLQDKQLMPLGGTRARALEVRVLAATNRPVAPGVASGLRDDLLGRLGASPLRVPPLRERPEDVAALAARFLAWPAGGPPPFAVPAFRALLLAPWPLNVRGLEKAMQTAAALTGRRRPITLDDLPADLAGAPSPDAPDPRPAGRKPPEPAPAALEIEALLDRHAGDVAEVSRTLGRQRAAVWRWIKQYGLDPAKHRRR